MIQSIARQRAVFTAALVLSGVVSTVSHAPVAEACGGFFCGQQPVDQSAERILFAVHGDGTTTMIVQIDYSGSDTDFAWILPLTQVPAASGLRTFPQLALSGLDARTGPQFRLPDGCAWGYRFDANAGGAAPPRSTTEGEVTVHVRTEVGPYDVAVIESTDASALVTWLRENGYRVTEPMVPYIRTYTDEGLKFLALKLRPGQGVNAIQPFALTLQGETPSIPIRLTSVAAEPEMGIVVFILGDRRYGPANWADVTVRDEDLVWDPVSGPYRTNWPAAVARAIDVAGGRGFVTELAGGTADLARQVRESMSTQPEQIEARDALLPLLEGSPYLTRLYARLSPEEMTLDPVFRRTAGGDVSNVHTLPRAVHGVDACGSESDWTPPRVSSSPCDFASCGRGGLCREARVEGGGVVAACACVPGAAARTILDPSGGVTVTCQDMRLSFVNPGDRAPGGSSVLGDPCVGFDCGPAGHCVAINMTPTCACDEGFVAIGSATSSGRTTRCVPPSNEVPSSFYDNRLPELPSALPGGRAIDVPQPRQRLGGGGACHVARAIGMEREGGVGLALGLLGLVALVRRRVRRG